MSKDIDIQLKKQILDIPKVLKKFIKNSGNDDHIVYYTGNWGQDLSDNLTEKQEERIRKELGKLSSGLYFYTRKLPDNVGGYHYIAYPRDEQTDGICI